MEALRQSSKDKIFSPVNDSQRIDAYIASLPDWQQEICSRARALIHKAEPAIQEEIKFTNQPYFTYKGNVCALLAAKDHVNIFIYDPIAPDPQAIINQGKENQTARSIQVVKGNFPNEEAFIKLIQAVVFNNKKGGWRHLKNS
ncbi:MAG TPA: DUF1801 domain-containing protein [Candidatus Saccharimonadales bacterium]|nr:DUF1801 domain-containing protein [Candidatus Saccharimonadales bacterium]